MYFTRHKDGERHHDKRKGLLHMKVVRARGYTYALEYHIVWCVKYKRKIITPEVEKSLNKTLHQSAADNNFQIIEFHTAPDYVRLLITASPQVIIPDIMKAMKGTSARYLLKHHPEIKEKLLDNHIWNQNYFIATASDELEQQIHDFVAAPPEK